MSRVISSHPPPPGPGWLGLNPESQDENTIFTTLEANGKEVLVEWGGISKIASHLLRTRVSTNTNERKNDDQMATELLFLFSG